MSRIISYPYDSNVVDADAWIGTEASTTRTKQYTASAVADYLNINGKISIGGQMVYQYVANPLQAAGTFSITSGGLDNVLFANITALTLSMTDRGGQNVVAFLNYLVGSDILISKQNEISSFGHYKVVSYNVNPNDSQFYDLVVVFKGGNGSMNFLDFYDAINFTLASEIVGSYTFNVDSDNGTLSTVQNNDTIDFTSTNITVSNIDSAISFNLPVTGVTAGAYTAANITVDDFGRVTAAASGTSGPGGAGTTNFVAKWVDATTLGDSVIFDNGTNVGIGTTSPGTKLHVKGGASGYLFRVQGTSTLNVYDPGPANEIGVGSGSGDKLKLFSNDSLNNGITIDTSGNVGIGTTSPSVKLDIVQSTDNQGIKISGFDDQSSSNLRLYTSNFGNNEIISSNALRLTSGASAILKSTASYLRLQAGGIPNQIQVDINYIKFDSSGNEIMRIDGTNERVGIGTTSPDAKLTVRGSSLTSEDLFHIEDSGGVRMMEVSTDPAGNASLQIKDTSGLTKSLINPAGNSYLNGGNVGIGTTSPSEKLHVDGNARVTGAYYDTSNSPGTTDQILSSTVTGTTWIDPSTITAEAATLVVIACKNTSGATITKGTPVYQTGTVGATSTIEIAPADALISANKLPAIGLLQTTLNANGIGKVVITGELTNFTTDPIDGLTPVTGQKIFLKSGGGLTLVKPTGEGNGVQNMGLVGKVSSGNSGSITVSSIMRTNDVPNLPEGRIWVGDGNTLVSDTIYIDEPNLRLGIGTTSPTYKLHNIGSSRLEGRVTLGGNVNNFIQGTGSSLDFKSNGDYNFTKGTDTLLKILSNGNVGIGTTSPGTKLDVNGNISIATTSGSTASNQISMVGSRAIFGYDGTIASAFMRSSDTSKPLVFGSGTSEFMRIVSSTGNVGIGTTNPNSILHITDANPEFILEDTTNLNRCRIKNVDGNLRYEADYNSQFGNSRHVFFIDGSEKLRINTNGNVGIGTTSPQAKLHVDGAIKVGTAQTLAASSTTVGAIRYRATTGASYMEMVMQTGVSGGIPVFAWVIIKQNTW